MPFIVECRRVSRQAKYKVSFEYHKEVVGRIKEINEEHRKWDSVAKCWVLHTRGLFELIKRYRGSDKIRFDFPDENGRKVFIDQIKKFNAEDIEKEKTIKIFAEKKEQWIKLKDDLDKDFEKYRESTQKNLIEGTNLYPHQIAATVFINEVKNLLLALDMGTGKISQVLHMLK